MDLGFCFLLLLLFLFPSFGAYFHHDHDARDSRFKSNVVSMLPIRSVRLRVSLSLFYFGFFLVIRRAKCI